MSNKKLTKSKKATTQSKHNITDDTTYTEMIFDAIDKLELATLSNIHDFLFSVIDSIFVFIFFWIFLDYLLELIALLLSNTYQVQNKLILTNVVDWLLESNILHVEYPACIKIINTNFENTTNTQNFMLLFCLRADVLF